jgi:hypothetical protein
MLTLYTETSNLRTLQIMARNLNCTFMNLASVLPMKYISLSRYLYHSLYLLLLVSQPPFYSRSGACKTQRDNKKLAEHGKRGKSDQQIAEQQQSKDRHKELNPTQTQGQTVGAEPCTDTRTDFRS